MFCWLSGRIPRLRGRGPRSGARCPWPGWEGPWRGGVGRLEVSEVEGRTLCEVLKGTPHTCCLPHHCPQRQPCGQESALRPPPSSFGAPSLVQPCDHPFVALAFPCLTGFSSSQFCPGVRKTHLAPGLSTSQAELAGHRPLSLPENPRGSGQRPRSQVTGAPCLVPASPWDGKLTTTGPSRRKELPLRGKTVSTPSSGHRSHPVPLLGLYRKNTFLPARSSLVWTSPGPGRVGRVTAHVSCVSGCLSSCT